MAARRAGRRRARGGSFGGVRDERFGPGAGGATFGIRRRVIKPCPTVQRFVVIQYRTRPVGNLRMKGMKAIGRIIISTRCDCCIVPDMKYVEATWLST